MQSTPGPHAEDTDPIAQAEAFLQEAVYRSREAQAGKALFAPGAKGQCGLGSEATIDLDLSPRAQELAQSLWPKPPSSQADLEHIRRQMTDWIERQDGFDRKRNHFLKAFRHKHGFRRADYAPDVLATYETGLEAIHSEICEARRAQALALISGVSCHGQ